eukprot:comp23702_c0_seq1/m.40723 comp23702_c0_seq1/g.40723  ORF comp23702_c0_seq1/g.40723 comp23702_c0_seq1/m.40723 type:complete len:262 (-) comp23702_c0_seq1:480-1265(-)
MAGKDLIIDVEAGGSDQLQFKDFGDLTGSTTPYRPPAGASSNADYSFDDGAGLLKPESRDSYGPSLWNMAYYAQFCDVDTQDVTRRIAMGMLPTRGSLLDTVASNPDLYGPYWVTTTLIFTIGMMGNLATYIVHEGQWVYDFTKVTFAATLMYCYVTLFPLAIWAFLTFYVKADIKLIEMVCLFGYSVSIYIPMTIICVAPSEAVRWLVVLLGFAMSSWTLLANLLPFIRRLHQKTAYTVLGAVALVQVVLALVFKLSFFA